MNAGVRLDERLRPVAVVDVPVDDEHAIEMMVAASVMGRDGHVAEETEAHGAIAERVVARRTNGREAAPGASVEGHVDAIEDAADGSRGRRPGSFAGHGIRVEGAAARGNERFDLPDIDRVVGQRDVLRGGVASLVVLDGAEELGPIAERAGDGAEAADVLGVAPARVVAAAVGVGDEGDAHGGALARRVVRHAARVVTGPGGGGGA